MAGPIGDIQGRLFALGDRVTFLDVHGTCGRCYQCLVARQSTRCPHRKVYGITYSANEGLLGVCGEHLRMKPGVHMVRPCPTRSTRRPSWGRLRAGPGVARRRSRRGATGA
ncbi:MAG: alcohol dehydrogenase catalytic domain-containing protein [Gemmatimonadetes bacterium]|nr:alcohol dehydrogenase catalytic domain-containing protein [Gemmatimonadota bacterium]